MAKKVTEEKINIGSILFKCRDILRKARNSGSFFEKRDMMLTLVFLRFIGEKFEDGLKKLRQDLIEQGLDPDDEAIVAAFFDDATFTDGTYNLPVEARWSTIINTPAPKLNVALDISAIYLDYSILRKQKARRIIKLAKENGWNIYVRYFDPYKAEYCYDTIKNIKPLIK